ncbi:MAG: hypothetical protein HQK96_09830 [Nitrospirae bacterium]|nr:hypothetical protein [Nitrospirota bacterium]
MKRCLLLVMVLIGFCGVLGLKHNAWSNEYAEGDIVCVKKWQGTGFCGVIDQIKGDRAKVEIQSINCGGLIGQCNADNNCSGGKDIGSASWAAGVGSSVWIKTYCITGTN